MYYNTVSHSKRAIKLCKLFPPFLHINYKGSQKLAMILHSFPPIIIPMKLLLPPPPNPSSSHLLLRRPSRTNPLVWLAATLCLLLALLLILSLVLALALFLLLRPRIPSFDAPAASLNSLHLDSPTRLNVDLSLLLNLSNPNTKINLLFQHAVIDLVLGGRVVASRALQPFALRRGGRLLEAVRVVASEVELPPEVAAEIASEVRGERGVLGFGVRGRFRVRASFGVGHFAYWLHGWCRVVMTGPPGGVLVARSCGTTRRGVFL